MTRQIRHALLTLASMFVLALLFLASFSDPAHACLNRDVSSTSAFEFLGFNLPPLLITRLPCPDEITKQSTSTTGGPGSAGGSLSPEAKARFFVSETYENLVEDLARGQGEYVTSLSTLLHVRYIDERAFAARLHRWLFFDRIETPTPEALANAALEIAQ